MYFSLQSILKQSIRFLSFLVLALLCSESYAQQNTGVKQDSITVTKTVTDSFNVKFLKPQGWVNDFENIFSGFEASALDSSISGFEKRTGIELVIVSIKKEWVSADHFEDFVTEIAGNWRIGKKDLNNGIIIGISKGLRKVRITTGNGVQEKLTDEKAKWIIDNLMIPEFKKGDFFTGALYGIDKIIATLQ